VPPGLRTMRGAFDDVSAGGQGCSDRGGSSGIAAALAADLRREGARVTLAGQDIEKTAVAAKAIGDAVRPIALDFYGRTHRRTTAR
jgi:NADP-dependent 3-hydroxy acid dehydrogenase YdfG